MVSVLAPLAVSYLVPRVVPFAMPLVVPASVSLSVPALVPPLVLASVLPSVLVVERLVKQISTLHKKISPQHFALGRKEEKKLINEYSNRL